MRLVDWWSLAPIRCQQELPTGGRGEEGNVIQCKELRCGTVQAVGQLTSVTAQL